MNCKGATAVADNALERAKHAEKELSKAMGEVEGLFIKVNIGTMFGTHCGF